MSGPRADDRLLTSAGRRIAWAEWGPAGGRPVLLLHRSPGSRLFDPDPAATARAGVRLITMDRPGYGGTDPVAVPSWDAAAADVITLVEALDLTGLAVVGWSGGGQFAVAAVARLLADPARRDRLRSLSLVATPAPDDAVAWWPDGVRPVVELARADPAAAVTVLAGPFEAFADPVAAAAGDAGAADAATRRAPGVLARLEAMTAEAVRQGTAGMVSDAVAGMGAQPRPVDLGGLPTRLWYGEDDIAFGPAHGRWYAEHLAGARLRMVPEAGHLLPLLCWARILDES